MDSAWGGIDNFIEVVHHIWSYRPTVLKAELAKPASDALVVWVLGGGKTGIKYSVAASFEFEGVTTPFFGEGMVNGQPLYNKTSNYLIDSADT